MFLIKITIPGINSLSFVLDEPSADTWLTGYRQNAKTWKTMRGAVRWMIQHKLTKIGTVECV